jgi:hypothetical protein
VYYKREISSDNDEEGQVAPLKDSENRVPQFAEGKQIDQFSAEKPNEVRQI